VRTTSGAAVADRTVPFNFLTVARRSRWPRQLLGFWAARSPDLSARLVGQLPLSAQLKALQLLYSARWARVGRFPVVGTGQPKERSDLRWVLFCANFTGEVDGYIRVFMESLPEGVHDIWGPAVGWTGFPAPVTATTLLGWVKRRLFESQHYYAAYSTASAFGVRAALRVRRELVSTVCDLEMAPDPEPRVAPALADLCVRLQHCLGTIDAPPGGWTEPVLGAGTVHGVVTVLPLLPGHERGLADALGRLPQGHLSPFAGVPGTHFARLAIIHRREDGDGDLGGLRNSYLVLAADVDAAGAKPADMVPFFRATFGALEPHAIWEHCRGNVERSPEAFVNVARRCTCPLLADYRDTPGQNVGAILDALRVQREFASVVVDPGRLPATSLDDLRQIVGR